MGYNENRAREDEFLGSAEYPLNTLLRKRLMEVELKIETKPTGSFITLKCVAVSALAESDSSSTQRQSLESNSENDVLSQLPTMNLHEKVPRHRILPIKRKKQYISRSKNKSLQVFFVVQHMADFSSAKQRCLHEHTILWEFVLDVHISSMYDVSVEEPREIWRGDRGVRIQKMNPGHPISNF